MTPKDKDTNIFRNFYALGSCPRVESIDFGLMLVAVILTFLCTKGAHDKIYVSRFLYFSVPRNRFGTKIRLVTQFDFSISKTDFYFKNKEIEEIRS